MFEETGWVNKIITAGIIGMIGWTLLSVQDLTVDIAVIQEQLSAVDKQFQLTTIDRYTRSEATADRALLEQRITRLEEWNTRLSDRLNRLETEIDGQR